MSGLGEKQKVILLLTATIRPRADSKALARVDPKLRLADYLDALGFYLDLIENRPEYSIVFSENSNSDISALSDVVVSRGLSDRVEFFSVDGLDYAPELGRGYGEFKLIDRAMRESVLIRNSAQRDFVWKITGRYKVRNFSRIIRNLPRDCGFYLNCRDYPNPWVDTYLLGWTVESYIQRLSGLFNNLMAEDRDSLKSQSWEELLRKWVAPLLVMPGVCPRMNPPPLLEGVRGYDNNNYSSVTFLCKYWIRLILGKVAPFIWL